jgi:hypothetical protein
MMVGKRFKRIFFSGLDLSFVMAGHSPSKDGRERPIVPAIHALLPKKQGVDARHKAGHDVER